MNDSDAQRAPDRLETGISGFDAVLRGGLLRRSVYLLQGRPGAGKTILANQICFHQAARGQRVLYVTLLSESHERMLSHLAALDFFDRSLIATRLSYVSAFSMLEDAGLKGLFELLSREARALRPAVIVIDGLVTLEETAPSVRDLKKLIHELQVLCSFVGSTMLLLTSARSDPSGPVQTMVDGVLEIREQRVDKRTEPELEITKFRGSSYLKGGHSFQITDAGIVVHPRLEALLRDPASTEPCKTERLSTGMPKLDEAFQGGSANFS